MDSNGFCYSYGTAQKWCSENSGQHTASFALLRFEDSSPMQWQRADRSRVAVIAGSSYCNDRVGPQSALAPLGNKPVSDANSKYSTEWMPLKNVPVRGDSADGATYDCQV